MKRDMELIRTILISIEENNSQMGWIDLDIPEYEDDMISYHVELLNNAGFIEAVDLSSMDGYEWKPKKITWNGHEFLDSIKNDTVWNEVKEQVKEKGGNISFEVLKALALQVSSKLFLS
ncbi:DUF2513 domain-containing protein [Sutcliffiella horikoshii]|uniref:DUF2513 domain-containing protein n=1 Tax=Sutcliffiella horikoshii TaxID=79883 RepID=UPI00384AEFD4